MGTGGFHSSPFFTVTSFAQRSPLKNIHLCNRRAQSLAVSLFVSVRSSKERLFSRSALHVNIPVLNVYLHVWWSALLSLNPPHKADKE